MAVVFFFFFFLVLGMEPRGALSLSDIPRPDLKMKVIQAGLELGILPSPPQPPG